MVTFTEEHSFDR